MIEDIKKYLDGFNGTLKEKDGLYSFSYEVASRETAINKASVSYTAKFRILDDEKLVRFTEIIKEASSGLGVGDEMSPGIGFKKESYKTGADGREGSITEKSNLGGKKLKYSLNYKEIRESIKQISEKNGYKFKYKILPWGI